MFTVSVSSPSGENPILYTDDPIVLQFNKAIDESCISPDFVAVWQTNETRTDYLATIPLSVVQGDSTTEVVIRPATAYPPSSLFVLRVKGSTISGDSETLGRNFVFNFSTAAVIRPTSSTVDVGDVIVPPSGGGSTSAFGASTDSFAVSGPSAQISLIRSYPAHLSVGASNITSIILLYNDQIDTNLSIPVESVMIRYYDLPTDLDPFLNSRITPDAIRISGNQLAIDMFLIPTENREFVVSVAGGIVRGVNRQGYDYEDHVIRFMGELRPVYTTPEQIRTKLAGLTGYTFDEETSSLDYGIWKSILEVSTWIRDVMHITPTAETVVAIGRLATCLVLRDSYLPTLLGRGNIKSRKLLETEVSFYDTDSEALSNALDECIGESSSSLGYSRLMALAGIRGEPYLNPATKQFRSSHRG